jgi:hypothetical protein
VYAKFKNEDCLLMNTIMPLYQPLDPEKQYPEVSEKIFQEDGLKVTLRPLSLPGDWAEMGDWFMDEFARGLVPVAQLPVSHLQDTFTAMLQCDFAQPFLGLINDHPAFLVEINEGGKQLSGFDGAHHVTDGDHFIRLILSPAVLSMRQFSYYSLLTSLEYFFSHQQVERIVWELNEKDKHYIHLANRIGFTEHRAGDWPGIHIFLYTKQQFSLQHLTSLQ